MEDVVFDANVMILMANGKLADGAVTYIERLFEEGRAFLNDVTYIECLAVPQNKREQLPAIQRIVKYCNRVKLTDQIIEETLTLCQSYPIKFRDAVAAATALSLNGAIITNDTGGFHHIQGLEVIRAERQD